MGRSQFLNPAFVKTTSVCDAMHLNCFPGQMVISVSIRYTSNACASKVQCTSVFTAEQMYLITFTADKVIFRLGLTPPPTPALNPVISHLHLLLVTLALPSFGWVRLGRENEHLLLESELGLGPFITLPAAPDLQVRGQTWTNWAGARLCWGRSGSGTFPCRTEATLI